MKKIRTYQDHIATTSNYVKYRTVRGKLVFEHSIKHGPWLLLDKDNGNPENGHGYVWFFATRQQARAHKQEQNSVQSNAKLVGPYKTAEVTSKFLARVRFTGR